MEIIWFVFAPFSSLMFSSGDQNSRPRFLFSPGSELLTRWTFAKIGVSS